MENHAHDPNIFLKMNIDCCKDCPNKLKKALLKMDGVYTVDINPEKKLVAITGKVDPTMLIQSIAKWGKSAELLSYTKTPKDSNKHHSKQESESECENQKGFKHKNIRQKGRERTYAGSPKNDPPEKGKKSHEPEAYVAPKIDEEICRDPYCKLHKRKPIIHNKVPSIDSADHPHHTWGSFHRIGGGSDFFNLGNSFQYDHPRMSSYPMMEPGPPLPPPPAPGYGFYSGSSYMPGYGSFDNFDYYGDHGANYRGWPPT